MNSSNVYHDTTGAPLKKGQLYHVHVRNKTLPNKYIYRGLRKLHCSLHGEYYGTAFVLQRVKNNPGQTLSYHVAYNVEDAKLTPANEESSQ